MPRLLMRSFCPLLVPAGILRLTAPFKVGTSTVAPNAASQGVIGKSLEASVSLGLDAKQLAKISKIQEEVKAVFIVSELKLSEAASISAKAEKFDGVKCVRCWKLFKQAEIHEGICPTCTAAVNK